MVGVLKGLIKQSPGFSLYKLLIKNLVDFKNFTQNWDEKFMRNVSASTV